ncbi:hypothetical protein [Priestia megaterium]|uniref:hypothetical protein n=1 Tax=Priestia megaterium TaxID=1404 RepID=UPI001D683832|nr:hypothetical protein [Priestia megaterium]CAH0313227.1 hypothetical protein SRABI82_05037 [Priestia megaterium]
MESSTITVTVPPYSKSIVTIFLDSSELETKVLVNSSPMTTQQMEIRFYQDFDKYEVRVEPLEFKSK